MYVTFPKLGLDFKIDRVATTLFGVDIYWYGIIISIAIISAALYCYKTAELHKINKNIYLDMFPFVIIFGIIGARLYYVAFKFDLFKDDLWSIFNLRDGGIAIYGAVIFGALGLYLACLFKNINFLDSVDVAVPALILAQAIGRLGNFINQEAFGANTNSIFGMYSQATNDYLTTYRGDLESMGIFVDPTKPVHPTFLYEMLLCLVGFLILVAYRKRRKFKGEMVLIYLFWYGMGRFFIEGLRTDSLMIGSLRASQILALIFVLISLFLICFLRRKYKLEGTIK